MDGPLSIADAMPLLRSGELTPSTLLEQCLARMDIYEPHVKAWVYVDRDRAHYEAAILTEELKNGKYRGPLHGIPIGVKDIIDVFDMPTGCGSRLWANSFARKDAEVVARLRKAGALILGKTVTTPFAYLDPAATRNPWNVDRTPGGSSSGSAAAVACGMCLAALATQTGGSTIRPASYCGVCAFKPTWGVLDVDGVLPLAPSLDHIGLMANSIRDLGILYECLKSDRKRAVFVMNSQLCLLPDFQPSSVSREMEAAFEGVLSELRSQKWRFTIQEPPTDLETYSAHQYAIYSREAMSYHGKRLLWSTSDYPPRIRELILAGAGVDSKTFKNALDHFHRTRSQIPEEIPEDCAGILIPATEGAAGDFSTTGSPAWQSPWTYAGVPVASFPIPSSGMPLAVQVIGRPLDDYQLLATAAQLEVAHRRRAELPPVPQ